MQYISPSIVLLTGEIGVVDVNTHKLAALEQRRKITNSFNSSLNANDIVDP